MFATGIMTESSRPHVTVECCKEAYYADAREGESSIGRSKDSVLGGAVMPTCDAARGDVKLLESAW